MKRTAMDHPKLMLLQHKLGIDKPATVGILECLWHFTAQYTPDGRIGKYPPAVVAENIGYTGDPVFLFQALEACGWLDRTDGGWTIHDWPDHCDDAVHLRMARAGTRFADGRMPKLARLSAAERRAALERFQRQETVRAHGVRTARAEAEAEAEAFAEAGACAIADAEHVGRSERSADEHHRVSAPGQPDVGPVSAAQLLPRLLGQFQARREDLAARILRATGDPEPYRDWWVRVARLMREHDGGDTLHEALRYVEDCADPAVRRAKDLGVLRAPGAFLAGRCRDHLAAGGARLPPPPRPAA